MELEVRINHLNSLGERIEELEDLKDGYKTFVDYKYQDKFKSLRRFIQNTVYRYNYNKKALEENSDIFTKIDENIFIFENEAVKIKYIKNKHLQENLSKYNIPERYKTRKNSEYLPIVTFKLQLPIDGKLINELYFLAHKEDLLSKVSSAHDLYMLSKKVNLLE